MANGEETFFGGFVKGVTKEFDRSRRQRLDLALQSSKLEQQLQLSLMKQAVKEGGRRHADVGIVRFIRDQASQITGVPADQIVSDPSSISAAELGSLAAFTRSAQFARAPKIEKDIIGGIQVRRIRDRLTGAVKRFEFAGLDPVNDRKLRSELAPLQRDAEAIRELKRLTLNTIRADSVLQRAFQAGTLTVNQLTQKNPDAIVLFRAIPTMASAVVRRFGDRGRLSDFDIERGKNLLPKIGDSTTVAVQLLDLILDLSEKEADIVINTFGSTTPELLEKTTTGINGLNSVNKQIRLILKKAGVDSARPSRKKRKKPKSLKDQNIDELFGGLK